MGAVLKFRFDTNVTTGATRIPNYATRLKRPPLTSSERWARKLARLRSKNPKGAALIESMTNAFLEHGE